MAPQPLTRYPVKCFHEDIFQKKCHFGAEPPRSHYRVPAVSHCSPGPTLHTFLPRIPFTATVNPLFLIRSIQACPARSSLRQDDKRGAGSSCSLFCFAKPCHGHRLTPKTRRRQPREKAFQNASTRLLEQWREPLLDVHRGLCSSVPLFFPRASLPPSCPLKQGKYLHLGKSKQTFFLFNRLLVP